MKKPNFDLKRRIMEKFGSQTDFAPEIGMREDRLSRLVNGRDKPKPELVERIAAALDCKPEEIFPS